MDNAQAVIEVDIEWVVDVVNEFSTSTRTAAGELDVVPKMKSGGRAQIENLSDGQLVLVADGWFRVFRSAPNPVLVCGALNDLLRDVNPTVSAVNDGSIVSTSIDFSESATAADRLLARGAIALLEVATEIGVERIGICSAGRCVDVYIDRSPRRNRRYCSELCQKRERVQRHRSRNRVQFSAPTQI